MDGIQEIVDQAKETAAQQERAYQTKITQLDEQIAKLIEERTKRLAVKKQWGLVQKLNDANNAGETWNKLSEWRKYKKENLLAVLTSGLNDLPAPLREGTGWDTNTPPEIKNDRDILIARASCQNFVDYYARCYYGWKDNRRHYVCSLHPFVLSDSLKDDVQVVAAVTRAIPHVLVQTNLSESIIFDSDLVFGAFVDDGLRNISDLYLNQLDKVLPRFSARIRSCSEFMVQAAKLGLNVFACVSGSDLCRDRDFCLQASQVFAAQVFASQCNFGDEYCLP